MIKIKRVYDPADKKDGFRILVDRLWPRGLSKEKACVHLWLRDAAPSDALRKWFAHDPKKWVEFWQRYRAELKGKPESLKMLRDVEKKKRVITLVYAASDPVHNNAAALANFLGVEHKEVKQDEASCDSTRAF